MKNILEEMKKQEIAQLKKDYLTAPLTLELFETEKRLDNYVRLMVTKSKLEFDTNLSENYKKLADEAETEKIQVCERSDKRWNEHYSLKCYIISDNYETSLLKFIQNELTKEEILSSLEEKQF